MLVYLFACSHAEDQTQNLRTHRQVPYHWVSTSAFIPLDLTVSPMKRNTRIPVDLQVRSYNDRNSLLIPAPGKERQVGLWVQSLPALHSKCQGTMWVSGIIQGKAKIFCDQECRGIEKKAPLRSRAKQWEVSEGTMERRVQELGTSRCWGTTAEISQRPWDKW